MIFLRKLCSCPQWHLCYLRPNVRWGNRRLTRIQMLSMQTSQVVLIARMKHQSREVVDLRREPIKAQKPFTVAMTTAHLADFPPVIINHPYRLYKHGDCGRFPTILPSTIKNVLNFSRQSWGNHDPSSMTFISLSSRWAMQMENRNLVAMVKFKPLRLHPKHTWPVCPVLSSPIKKNQSSWLATRTD